MENYKAKNISVFLLRLAMGWLFFYAGITKVLDSTWTSEGYLKSAQTFTSFYNWLASPDILPFVDFINQWGLTLLGISLILGLFVRFSTPLGALMMLLYYLPILSFPYIGINSFLVDQHIVYAFSLLVLGFIGAGNVFGLDGFFRKLYGG